MVPFYDFRKYFRFNFFACFVICFIFAFPRLVFASALPNSVQVTSTSGRLLTLYPSTLQAANDGRFLATVDAVDGTVARRATVAVAPNLNRLLSKVVAVATPGRWIGAAIFAAGLADLSVMWLNSDETVTATPHDDASVPVIPASPSGAGWVPVGSNYTTANPDGQGGTITVYGNAPGYYRYSASVRVFIPESFRLAYNSFVTSGYPSAPLLPSTPSSSYLWMNVNGSLSYEQRYTADLTATNYPPLTGLSTLSDAQVAAALPAIFGMSTPTPLPDSTINDLMVSTLQSLGSNLPQSLVVDGALDGQFYDVSDPFDSPEADSYKDSDSATSNPEDSQFDPSVFDLKLPTKVFDFSTAISPGSTWLPHTCPEDVVLIDNSFFGHHVFSYASACSIMTDYVSKIMLLLAWISAFVIVFKTVSKS